MDPNGSNVAPIGNGNTKSQSSRKSPRKHWILTLQCGENWNIGSNGSNFKKWIIEHCSRATWQVERGEQTARLHVQCSLTLKVKQRLEWLKHHMSPTAHFEEIRNQEASFDYTCKTDTRVHGPYYWPEPIQPGVLDPLLGKVYYTWQKEIIEEIQKHPDPRKIFWYWETTGNVGKSDFCLHLILNYNAVVYDGAKKDILHAHKGQTVVIFDFDRMKEGTMVSYAAMESLKKGFCFSGKYESGMKVYPKPHIFVFANWPPIMEGTLSEDRWVVKEITKE